MIRAERIPVGRLLACGTTLSLLLAASGCGLFSGDDDPAVPAASAAPETAVVGLQQTLDRRARALRRDDRRAFVSTLGGDRAFRRAQLAYFDAIEALPADDLKLTVRPAEVVLEGDSYWAVVDVRMRLDGYDTMPVVTRDRYLFTPGAREGRFRLASTTDAAWEARNDVVSEPWETGAVEIRESGGVLGVFDAATIGSADRILATVGEGVSDVAAVVPYDWSRQVVVYALGDPAFLQQVAPTMGEGGLLAGVAFEVWAGVDTPQVASTRIVLAPESLTAPDLALGRLVRHELTHVVLGTRDDDAPRWLQEGLAEYVSTRDVAPARRQVPQSALAALRTPPASLPADDGFTSADADVTTDYALGWWACEEIARTQGESRLWSLLDAYTTPEDAQDAGAAVLRAQTGLTAPQLARRAARLLLSIYDPTALTPEPSAPASGATSAPTSAPTSDEAQTSSTPSPSGSPAGIS